MDACEAINTANAGFDHWDGATRATVKNSTVYCLSGYGVLFNSAPTGGTEHLDAEWFTCENVRVFNPGSGCAGIYVDPIGSSNKIGRIMVKDSYVFCSGAGGGGIIARGNPGYMQIIGNTIEGVVGQAIELSVGAASGSPIPSGGLVKDNMFVNCSNSSGPIILVNDCDIVRVEGNMAIGGSYQFFVQGQLTNGLIVGPNSATAFTSAKYFFNNSQGQPILFDSDEANLRFRSNVAIVQDT